MQIKPSASLPQISRDVLYRALFDSIGEGFCIIELKFNAANHPIDYRFIEVNAAFERQTGLKDAAGQWMRDLAPAHESHWYELYGHVALTGQSRRFEQHAQALGRWFNVYAFRIGDSRSRLVAIVFDDITQRKQIEAEREAAQQREREANAHLDALFASSPVGLAFIDPDLRYRRINSQLAKMNGISAEAHLGKRPDEILPGVEGIDAILEGWREVLRTGRPWLGVEVTGKTPAAPGEVRTWQESFFPVRVADKIVGLGALVEEITDRKRAELRLKDAAEALQNADRRKDEFLATLAHELRNPLAPLRNGLQIARLTSKADSPFQRTVEMMDRQLSHLVHLVDDLLDVGRITSGKIQLNFTEVPLREALGQSAEAARTIIDAHEHELIIESGPEDLYVQGDLDRLTQVFSNLLSNAAKYTEGHGTIRLSLAREGDEAVVRVTDTGIGIPAPDLPHVFDLFSQVRAHQGRAEGGLGIGLSLVWRLVEMHAGSVSAASAGTGQGSTFTVRLPLIEQSAPAPRHSEMAGMATAGRRSVLVVDDNTEAAVTLAMLLEYQGHAVSVAHSGAEALEKVRAVKPDLVFLDLGMPQMDGIEVARQLRATREGRHVQLVALTGWGQERDQQRTREAGFDRHLLKPVDPQVLAEILAQRSAR